MLETAMKKLGPSGCGCGTSAALARQPAYVVGTLGFDFGTEARRDALYAAAGMTLGTNQDLAAHLKAAPWDAAQVLFTLNNDGYAQYVLRPAPAYGQEGYAALQGFLADSTIARISVPGWIAGSARLLNGQTVPVIEPDLQGLRGWSALATNAIQAASITGSVAAISPTPPATSATIDLSAAGSAVDWAYFGPNGTAAYYDHSVTGSSQISLLTELPIGGSAWTPISAAAGAGTVFTWNDGNTTPLSGSSPNCLQCPAAGGGFQFTVPADPLSRTLSVYVGTSGPAGTLTATVSDPKNPVTWQCTVPATSGGTSGNSVITLKYQAEVVGQTLTVQWTNLGTPANTGTANTGTGNTGVSIQAASLKMAASVSDLQNFMNRIYYEMRNQGVTPQERAINYAATQAYFTANVYTYAFSSGLNLQGISVAHSPLCRPGSECWDVTVNFFDPQQVVTMAHKMFRFTIDVSDVKPVFLTPVFKWNAYY
jgi:hypothetical protein